MKYSEIRNLCAKSNLEIVNLAYGDVTDWYENPSDERIIQEIEWKLENAQCDYEDDTEEYTKEDIAETKKFLKKLKGIQKRIK